MNLVPGARSFLRRASTRLSTARRMLRARNLPEVVRFSQEATEMALKAALRLEGVDYPKRHDPGQALLDAAPRFPAWFRDRLERMVRLSAELTRYRELAVYGDEGSGRTAEQVFEDSRPVTRWLTDAESVYRDCLRLYRERARSPEPHAQGDRPSPDRESRES